MLRRVSSSCLLCSSTQFPRVVMPATPWRQTAAVASSTPSPQAAADINSVSLNTASDEDNRVMALGERVNSVLSAAAQASSSSSAQIKQHEQRPPQEQQSDYERELDAVSKMMNEQTRELCDAETLLRGGNTAAASTQAQQQNPELAWAERILQQQQHDSSSASVGGDASSDRKAAMMQFMKQQQQEQQEQHAKPSAANTDDDALVGSRLLRKLYQLQPADTSELTEAETTELVDWIDSFVQRPASVAATTTAATASVDPLDAAQRCDGDENDDWADREPASEKEDRFTAALTDAAALLDQCGFERKQWFIACGTALGCIREKGKFIAHDNDVDLGIFYDGSTLSDPFHRLVALTSPALPPRPGNNSSSKFFCFDTLGALHYGGFQLRLLHLESGVMVDVNVHYLSDVDEKTGVPTACEPSNTAAAASHRPRGWWFGMFYGDSAKRKHGMYRCWFTEEALAPEKTCAERTMAGVTGLHCPGEKYLVEYFGPDWQTPRKYSYEEALDKKLFRNLIEE